MRMTNAWRTPQAGIFVLKKEKTSGAGVIGFTRTDGRPCCWPAVEASSRNGWLSLSLGITLRNLPVFSLPGRARAAAGRRRAQRAYVAELGGAARGSHAIATETEGRALHFQTTSARHRPKQPTSLKTQPGSRGAVLSKAGKGVVCSCSEHVRATGEATPPHIGVRFFFYHQYRIVLLYLDRIYTCY